MLELYSYFLGAFFCILAAIFLRTSITAPITFTFLGITFPILNNTILIVILITSSIISLCQYVIIDYSKFFPIELEMEIFYDDKNIRNNLSVFTEEELNSYGYNGYNKNAIDEYYSLLDKKLNKILNYNNFFSVQDGVVHSQGKTTFMVKKTDGIHNYHIYNSSGELKHTLERPGKTTFNFTSFFEKLESPNDYIRPSVLDIILKRNIVIAPKFKQILADKYGNNNTPFDHVLVGMTKVYLFPYPSFSNTTYFIEDKNRGIIPIGYAVYYVEK